MNQEYVYAVMGGFFVALSISTNFIFNGKLLGFSGISQGLIQKDPNFHYKVTILVSILLFNSVIFLIGNEPGFQKYNFYETP